MYTPRLLLSVLVLAVPACASVVSTYTSDPALKAANPSVTFVNINFGLYSGNSYNNAAGLVDAATGVNFVGMTGSSFDLAVANAVVENVFGGVIHSIEIKSLPSTARAFGVNITGGGSVTVSTSSGSTFNSPVTTPGFLGVVTDAAISDIMITAASSQITIDSFEVGTPGVAQAQVPEAKSFFLIGGGLIFLRLLRRSKQP